MLSFARCSGSRSVGHRYFSLLRDKNYIGGEWVAASSGKTFQVTNPVNDKVIGIAQDSTPEDAEKAIKVASGSFKMWADLPAKEKGIKLKSLLKLVNTHSDDLAKLITAECGKPLAEAKAEVMYSAGYLEWYAEEAKRIYGEVLAPPNNTRELVVLKEPIGVVGFITPWNFPLAMLVRKAAAALAAGCVCVARPAEDTPFSALALAALVEEAGFPAGTFNVVTSSRSQAGPIGQALCASPQVAGISFTGSTAVGKILYQQCANTVKRLGLELGGNASYIIFPTADLSRAVQGVMGSKFRNAGQACVATNRVLVHESVFDKFSSMLATAVKTQLVSGDGFDPAVNQGPLINEQQFKKVDGIVKDAVSKGARLVSGGGIHPTLKGRFYQPTVLSNITENMKIYNEEIFGPICPLYKFYSEDEAVTIANSTRRGLANYFYSNDYAQVWRVAKRLESGMVGVNEGLISAAEAPFGGVKESGFGREGSRHGVDDYVHTKYVCFGGLQN
ncbi:succinate-semialdehyde dehydrogenase, mitochondrial-like [Daphnia carinata]|uniref:succinate-semialdehyde dehydrogenase, mitochondrial-like n=1 Tax=Daphnia carinata TaxID=120202 RepID=UPI00257D2DCC|nr:succinate-semialdehyde dehydrogenase, mitochondrial-like [Daphnia carinata]